MADLRAWVEAAGYDHVATYIQSGNVVLTGPDRPTSAVEADVKAAIRTGCGLDVAVMVRTRDELAVVVAANPYPEADDEPTKVHVAFLSGEPDLTRLEAIDPASYAPDEWTAGPGVLYLRMPEGMGRSKLAIAMGDKRSAPVATVRNWRTVTKLVELSAD